MGAAFLLPLIAYLDSLGLSHGIASRLVVPDPSLGVRASASSTLAYAIFEPYLLLLYLGAALAAWQAVTFTQAISEVGPRAAHFLHRAIAASARLSHSRGVLAGLVLLATAKLGFDIAGYSHRLPGALGGNAAIWSHGQSPYVWYYTGLVAVPVSVLLLGRLRNEHTRLSLTSPLIVLATLFALLGPVQVLTEALTDFDPSLGIHPPAGQALFISPQLLSEIALGASGLVFFYYWRRHPPAAALFGISFAINAPGVIASALAAEPPVPGIGRFDLVVSALMLAWCLAHLLRVTHRPPTPWFIAVWLGLTVLTHFTTLVPGHTQTAWFVVGALLPLAYGLLWAGSELNELALRHPAQATLALCTMSTLLLIVAVQVWAGDRFGREFNAFIDGGSIFQETSRQLIGVPLLALLCWRAFASRPTTQPASRARTHVRHDASRAYTQDRRVYRDRSSRARRPAGALHALRLPRTERNKFCTRLPCTAERRARPRDRRPGRHLRSDPAESASGSRKPLSGRVAHGLRVRLETYLCTGRGTAQPDNDRDHAAQCFASALPLLV
jgi:hypothetical protein